MAKRKIDRRFKESQEDVELKSKKSNLPLEKN